MPAYHSHGLCIYTNSFAAAELILVCHGGLTQGDGSIKVPSGTQVCFYTGHWKTASGGAVACALAGRQGATPYVPKVNSIASGGSQIWNYTLTWDGPGGMRPYERKLIEDYGHGLGSPLRDLATPVEGTSTDLKSLFKAIAKVKGHYDVIHYCPCRSVSDAEGNDVYEPFFAEQMKSMTFKQ